MKVFIMGLPGSGKTTVSKSICENLGAVHLDPASWMKYIFRNQDKKETNQEYIDLYFEDLNKKLINDVDLVSRLITDIIKAHPAVNDNPIVIDGLSSPRDFIQLFDYSKDLVVFLNRIDNEAEYRNVQNISISVMKDYCLWLASSNLLNKEKWIEVNFQMDDDKDYIKCLSRKNTLIMVRNIKSVIATLIKMIP